MTANLDVLAALGFDPSEAKRVAAVRAAAALAAEWADPDHRSDAPTYIGHPKRSSYWLDETDIFWTEAQIENEATPLKERGIHYTLWREQRKARSAELKELAELKDERPHDQALHGQYGCIELYDETQSLDEYDDDDNTDQPSGPWYIDPVAGHSSAIKEASYAFEQILVGEQPASFAFPEVEPSMLKQADAAYADALDPQLILPVTAERMRRLALTSDELAQE